MAARPQEGGARALGHGAELRGWVQGGGGAQEGESALDGAVGALGGLVVRVECKEGAAGPASQPLACLTGVF